MIRALSVASSPPDSRLFRVRKRNEPHISSRATVVPPTPRGDSRRKSVRLQSDARREDFRQPLRWLQRQLLRRQLQ